MGVSFDSSRPIMAPSLMSKRTTSTSNRLSTYSMAPTVNSAHSNDTVQQEINDITDGLHKLENKKLANQRFVPSETKTDLLSKLALGAKLERALGRRMGGQDAIMRPKKSTAIVTGEKTKAEAVAV